MNKKFLQPLVLTLATGLFLIAIPKPMLATSCSGGAPTTKQGCQQRPCDPTTECFDGIHYNCNCEHQQVGNALLCQSRCQWKS